MPRLIQTLPLIVALGLGAPAWAQDDTETTAQETTTEETTGADDGQATSEAGLDMGQDVQEDPTYVKEEFGDWQLRCFRSGAEEDPCQMFQLLTEEAGNPVAEFSLYRLPEGAQAAAGATIVVPLGTLLSEGVKISVDGGKAKSYTYSFCSMAGCYARIGLTAADVAAFKRGVVATLQIVPAQAPDQKVDIKASLSGFTAAFENASVLQQ